MSKKVTVISTSLRGNSNSDMLAGSFARGAEDAGNEVETISLRGKQIAFCMGCMACQSKGSCVINDDAIEIAQKVHDSDVIVWATPIYYYEMSGQMKTLIDRMNSLYSSDYKFREVYVLASAAEDEEYTPVKAIEGVKGWIDCFSEVELKGTVFCGGVDKPGEIEGNSKLTDAYNMGKNI